ncbi:MAG: MucR family transcriptional regulator [Pseudomonadota bacterium]
MTEETLAQIENEDLLEMTTTIVASFLSHNSVPADNVSDLIKSVHATMKEISGGEAKPEVKSKPAVPISRSVQDDHIVCLEDGKKLKMLKRYLRSQYDMSPDDYRRKWGLPADYPMVAPSYSRRRSDFAKQIGLGRGGRKG